MSTDHHLEALLEGAIAAGVCPELRDCVPATGELLPAQYVLLTRDLPQARARLRCAAQALLALLEIADAAYAANGDGCGPFRALDAAPEWLLRPSDPDDTDLDVALICECAIDHGGDWHALLEALHRAGSVEWQWAIRRCRALMRFEEETDVDLAELIGVPDSTMEGLKEDENGAMSRSRQAEARESPRLGSTGDHW
jgi:hypothetical protein